MFIFDPREEIITCSNKTVRQKIHLKNETVNFSSTKAHPVYTNRLASMYQHWSELGSSLDATKKTYDYD